MEMIDYLGCGKERELGEALNVSLCTQECGKWDETGGGYGGGCHPKRLQRVWPV